jgi:hypothetical protein
MALLFMNSSTALAAKPSMLHSILDRRGIGVGGAPPALAARIKSIPAQGQIWIAALGPFKNFDMPLPGSSSLSMPTQVFQTLESVVAFADLRAGCDISATAVCGAEQDAKRLHDALRGIIGMGRLSTPDNQPDLLRFYDSVKVEQQQGEVRVRIQISLELLDKLIQSLPSPKPGARAVR